MGMAGRMLPFSAPRQASGMSMAIVQSMVWHLARTETTLCRHLTPMRMEIRTNKYFGSGYKVSDVNCFLARLVSPQRNGVKLVEY